MKAITYSTYGPPEVLQLREVVKPTPKDKEVLIRIYATTVTAGDCESRNSKTLSESRLFGLIQPGPIILGQELAGEIEGVGQKVTRFRVGDQIVGWSSLRLGTYAEYTCLPERGVLFIKPANMTYGEAATLPVGGLDAVYLLRKANIQRGEKVLINGAGGSMGTYAVQIAKYFGAEVTGVDSTAKLDMLRSIGFDHVVDYTSEDVSLGEPRFDLIMDIAGTHPLRHYRRVMTGGATYVTVGSVVDRFLRPILYGKVLTLVTSERFTSFVAKRNAEDLADLAERIDAGQIVPVIDRTYPMAEVPDAVRYLEAGHVAGKLVLTV